VPQVVNNEPITFTIKANYAKEISIAADAAALVRRINLIMCAGQLSAATLDIIVTALNKTVLPPATASAVDIETAKLNRIAAAILLTMACPEYLIQK
jgi:hypothetical protein